MSRLKIFSDVVALAALSSQALAYVLYLSMLYKIKKSKAEKAARKELEMQEIDEKTREELLEIIVPDLGGITEWMSLMKLKSYY